MKVAHHSQKLLNSEPDTLNPYFRICRRRKEFDPLLCLDLTLFRVWMWPLCVFGFDSLPLDGERVLTTKQSQRLSGAIQDRSVQPLPHADHQRQFAF